MYDYDGDMGYFQRQLEKAGISQEEVDMNNYAGLTARELQSMVRLRQSRLENQRRRRKAMASLEVKTEWAVYKDCFLQVARYQADNSRAIEIWNNEDGPIARITVCITGSGLAEDETVIDTNNCPWAMEFIKQHGFGQATGRMVKSGYCTYPVVKLDIEKIGEYLEVA